MFNDRNPTVTDVVTARVYGQSRTASRSRIGRQNVAARKDRLARSEPLFVSADEHAELLARGRALLESDAADLVAAVNVGSAVRMLEAAEVSWRRPGHVVVRINQRDAVLLGNVFRRLNGFGPALVRLDALAGREPPAGASFDVLTHELIAALEALDAAGEARAAALLRTAMVAGTTWRIHVAPADASWLAEALRAVDAPWRFLAALAPIAGTNTGSDV